MISVKLDADVPAVGLLEAVWIGTKEALAAAAAEAAPDLRTSHVRVLSMTSPHGMRVGELAARTGMTSQSLGEFVAILEQAGYLSVSLDSADRRVRLLLPTTKGLQVKAQMQLELERLENAWRKQVGLQRWTQFREVLTLLGEHLQASDT